MKNVFHKKGILLKAVAIMCCIVMTAAQFAVCVNAEDSEKPEGLVSKKQVKWEGGTNYTLQIETYVTGETVYVTEVDPADIVLVLDVSGSMGENTIDVPNAYKAVYAGDIKTDGSVNYYYMDSDGDYNRLYYCDKGDEALFSWNRHDPAWYTQAHETIFGVGGHDKGEMKTPKTSASDTSSDHTQFYELVVDDAHPTRMKAMQNNVNKFIDSMAKLSSELRISVVKFASEYYDDENLLTEGNHRSYGENYTELVKGLTKLDSTGVTALKASVDSLVSGGATAADYGLTVAKAVLENAKTEENYDRNQFVIVFTDGEPNHGNDFDSSVANSSIAIAEEMKNGGTRIFSLACFDEADESSIKLMGASGWNSLSDMNKYLNLISSNVSGYTNKSKTLTMSTGYSSFAGYINDKQYFYTTNTTSKMASAFDAVAREIGISSIRITEQCAFKDYIAPDFSLIENYIGGEFDIHYGITWHTETYVGGDKEWEEDSPEDYEGVEVVVNASLNPLTSDNCSQVVEIKGFDAAGYYVDYEMKSKTHVGKKLVINIPIEYIGEGEAGGNVNTNGKDSGWYGEDGNLVDGGEIPSPVAEIPTVTNITLGVRHKADPATNVTFHADGAVQTVDEFSGTSGYTDKVVLDDSDLTTDFTLAGEDDESTADTAENAITLYGRDYAKLGLESKAITITASGIPLGYKLYADFNGAETEVALTGTDNLSGTYTYTPTGSGNTVNFYLDYKPTHKFVLSNSTVGDIETTNPESFTVSYTDYDNKPVSLTFTLQKGETTETTTSLTDDEKKLLAAVAEDAVITVKSNGHDGFVLNYVNGAGDILGGNDTYDTPAITEDITLIAKFTSGIEFPITGSVGRLIFIVSGAVIMAGAVAGLIVLKRKKLNEN